MRTADFDFNLPPALIAQHPTRARDASRLLVVKRGTGTFEHRQFADLPHYLQAGDLLVMNNSKVIPARLHAAHPVTGGQLEILLLEENAPNDWWAMVRPGKKARVGSTWTLQDRQRQLTSLTATVTETNDEGHRRLSFSGVDNIHAVLDRFGEPPLPPYIKRDGEHPTEDHDRYQTVYARDKGSVAAPTAGLHFTEALLAQLAERGVEICFITLHVGPGTFAPVKADRLENHVMHSERFEVDSATADRINRARAERRRVVCVGTTTVRVLESVAREHDGAVMSGSGRTNIFIYPPYPFRIANALLTNFHLPRSTLLMLVSAFAAPGELGGEKMILAAYAEAIKEKYRFFSYGDAMLIE